MKDSVEKLEFVSVLLWNDGPVVIEARKDGIQYVCVIVNDDHYICVAANTIDLLDGKIDLLGVFEETKEILVTDHALNIVRVSTFEELDHEWLPGAGLFLGE